ncbi:Transcriptional regulatory protein YpdB [compost metagenome]
MMRAIALDDEPLSLELIETYSKVFPFIQFEQGFSKAGAALRYLEKNSADLIFLDIHMPAVNGLDFYRSLKHKPMLIFTTSYSEHALESYELGAIDYLLKPFTIVRFEQAVTKAFQQYNLVHNGIVDEKSKYLLLKADHGIVKVFLSEISYIEGLDNYLKINQQNNKSVVVRMTMKALMEKLNPKEFLRVHKSYIVPIAKVGTIQHKTIILIDGHEIPIGKNYEEAVKSIW